MSERQKVNLFSLLGSFESEYHVVFFAVFCSLVRIKNCPDVAVHLKIWIINSFMFHVS